MNLNPLKKDDNTDALVKALEDANNVDVDGAVAQPAANAAAPQPAPVADTTGVTDSSVIASDPQVTEEPAVDAAAPAELPAPAPEPVAPDPAPAAADSPATTDSSTGITFDGNDLPAGLSSDADAHLPTEGSGEDGEIDGVKKSALEQLRPLIEKLDLEPADKFDKYLMMLRASDDPALIKPAFEAAQGIAGEKERAQALLDIINEINYITANQQQN